MPHLSGAPRLALALATSLTLASCAQAPLISPAATVNSPASTAAVPLVSGLVAAGASLSGATATLTGADGKVIATQPVMDDMYLFQLDSVPASYRVTVTGGTLDGKAFTGELRAEHRAASQLTAGPRVDWLSTLASRSMEAHPGQSLPDALGAVKAYLQIPDDAPAEFWEEIEGYYDNTAFYTANSADLKGAVDRALAGVGSGQHQAYPPAAVTPDVAPQAGTVKDFTPDENADEPLVTEADLDEIAASAAAAPAPATYGVKALPVLAVSAAKFVGENLGGIAIGAGTDFAINLLLGGGSDSGDLSSVSDKIDTLQAAVDKLQTQVEQVQSSVRTQTTFTDYNGTYQTVLSEQVVKLDTMDAYHEQLSRAVRKNSGYTPAQIAALRSQVLAYEDGVFAFPQEVLTRWESAVNTLLPLGAKYVAARDANFITPTSSLDHFNQWAYFDGLQAKMVTYMTTYLTAKKAGDAVTKNYLQQWQAMRVREMAKLRSVPSNLATDDLAIKNFGIANVTTQLNAMPENTMADRVNKRFWRLDVTNKVMPRYLNDAVSQYEVKWVPSNGFFGLGKILGLKAATPSDWRVAGAAEHVALHKDGSAYRTFASLGFASTLDVGNAVFFTNSRYPDSLSRLAAGSYSIGPAFGVSLTEDQMYAENEFKTAAAYKLGQGSTGFRTPDALVLKAGFKLPATIVPPNFTRIRSLSPDEMTTRDVDIAYMQSNTVKTARIQYDIRPTVISDATWSAGLSVMAYRPMTADEQSKLMGTP